MAPIILCLGGASCFERDWFEWHRQFPSVPYDVAACNDAGVFVPGEYKLWATLHPDKMVNEWAPMRQAAGLPMPEHVIANKGGKGRVIQRVIPRGWRQPDGEYQDWNGSSGLYTPTLAVLHLGYRRAVLIGIPMDGTPNRFRDEGKWQDATRYREGWKLAKECPDFYPRVRSMSGWTAEQLGQPDWEWLSEA